MVLGQTFGGGNLYFIALWSDVATPGGSLATSWCHVAWVLLRQYSANEHRIEGVVMHSYHCMPIYLSAKTVIR